MFNYFACQKQQEAKNTWKSRKDLEQRLSQQKKKKNNCLLKNYIERTSHGYQKMVDASEQLKEYKKYKHQFRDYNKKLNVGPPSFYFKNRTEKQRIQSAYKQNQNLDEIPFFGKQNPSTHKFRTQQNQKPFKFTSLDSTSRVLQTVKMMNTNELPSSWDADLKGYLSSYRQKSDSESKIQILPNLNVKTHPNSITSIKNKLPIGPLKDVQIQSRKELSLPKNDYEKIQNKKTRFHTFHLDKVQKKQNSQYS